MDDTYFFCDFIPFCVKKGKIAIKMLVPEHSLSSQLIRDPPLHLHHQFQHFVVCFAGKEDLARVELIE